MYYLKMDGILFLLDLNYWDFHISGFILQIKKFIFKHVFMFLLDYKFWFLSKLQNFYSNQRKYIFHYINFKTKEKYILQNLL